MAWGTWRGWPIAAGLPVPTVPTAFPYWFKFTVTHTQLQAAALTNDIELYSMPAGVLIHGSKLKHSVQFAGVGITDYKISIGFTGELEAVMPLYDVDTAPANDVFAINHCFDSRNHGAVTSVRVAAQAVGANLSASTAGSADIWLNLSELV